MWWAAFYTEHPGLPPGLCQPASQPAQPALPFPELCRPLRTGLDGVAEGRMQNCPVLFLALLWPGHFLAVMGAWGYWAATMVIPVSVEGRLMVLGIKFP